MAEPLAFFSLESPLPPQIKAGSPVEFTGIVFDDEGSEDRVIRIHADDRLLGQGDADQWSPEIGRHLRHLPATTHCRFRLSAEVPESSSRLRFETARPGGDPEWLAEYDLGRLALERGRIDSLLARVASLPAPPPDIVELTQGHRDAGAYQDSLVPSLLAIEAYLEESSAPLRNLRSILDFGCGSGRLLAALMLDDPSRDLRGCDINRALIDWASGNLPQSLRFETNELSPPLTCRDRSFDLVLATSVFTHFGPSRQKDWARELARCLRRGGLLLATLHGKPYVRLFQRDRESEFESAGYIEIARGGEGANSFATFHSRAAAESLFAGLELLSMFPSGKIRGVTRVHPLAAFQDVYVFRKN